MSEDNLLCAEDAGEALAMEAELDALMGIIRKTSESVREFLSVFDVSTDMNLWANLVLEESLELLAELKGDDTTDEGMARTLKESADLFYVATGLNLTSPANVHYIVSSARMDRLSSIIAAAFELLRKARQVFSDEVICEAIRRVHVSNMTKLDDNGMPIRDETGKIQKGPNYRAPDLIDLVKGNENAVD